MLIMARSYAHFVLGCGYAGVVDGPKKPVEFDRTDLASLISHLLTKWNGIITLQSRWASRTIGTRNNHTRFFHLDDDGKNLFNKIQGGNPISFSQLSYLLKDFKEVIHLSSSYHHDIFRFTNPLCSYIPGNINGTIIRMMGYYEKRKI